MSKQKIYISKQYLEYHTEVIIEENGEKVKKRIDFMGGQRMPRRIHGRFITDDPKIQEALESHPGFKEKFDLQGKPASKKPVKKKDDPVVVKEITLVNEAKDFLTDKENNFDVKLSELPNKETILKKAEELNIEFPNLK